MLQVKTINSFYDGFYSKREVKGASKTFWKLVSEQLSLLGDGEVLLIEFEDVIVKNPLKSEYFAELFNDERLYLKFYDSESEVKVLQDTATIANLNPSRFMNVNTVVESKPEPETQETLIDKAKSSLDIIRPYTSLKGDTLVIDVGSDSGSYHYDTIYYAILQILKENQVNKCIFYLRNSTISNFIIEKLLTIKGIKLLSDDDKISENIRLIQRQPRMAGKPNAQIFKGLIGSVGLLVRYAETRRRDAFGRMNDGEAIRCNVAILRRMYKVNRINRIMLEFEVYKASDFQTNTKRIVQNSANVKKPQSWVEQVSLSQIGYEQESNGELYQFTEPLYEEKDGYFTEYTNVNGQIIETNLTLPQLIYTVFDEYNIDYNKEKLEQIITYNSVND